jgi:hypothetical protein
MPIPNADDKAVDGLPTVLATKAVDDKAVDALVDAKNADKAVDALVDAKNADDKTVNALVTALQLGKTADDKAVDALVHTKNANG